MQDILRPLIPLLNDEQIAFICKEWGVTSTQLFSASESELDALYDLLCDIEIDESFAVGEAPLSKRGDMAEELVTLFGNAIAEAAGLLSENDFITN